MRLPKHSVTLAIPLEWKPVEIFFRDGSITATISGSFSLRDLCGSDTTAPRSGVLLTLLRTLSPLFQLHVSRSSWRQIMSGAPLHILGQETEQPSGPSSPRESPDSPKLSTVPLPPKATRKPRSARRACVVEGFRA